MVDIKILKAYGKAFFDISLGEGKLDSVFMDLKTVGGAVRGSKEFASFAGNYGIKKEKRAAVLEALFSGRIDSLTLKFLHFLEKKRRLEIIGDLAGYFEKLYDDYRGIIKIVIISAFPMGNEQVETIRDKFGRKFQKHIEADVKTDPKLLGGFQIRAGDVVYDYSTKRRLELIYKNLVNG